jgi:hypothetical protein
LFNLLIKYYELDPVTKPPMTPPTSAPKMGIGISAYPIIAPEIVPPIVVPDYNANFPNFPILESKFDTLFLTI